MGVFVKICGLCSRADVEAVAALRPDAFQELFDPNHSSFQNFGVNIVNSLLVAIPTSIIAVIL